MRTRSFLLNVVFSLILGLCATTLSAQLACSATAAFTYTVNGGYTVQFNNTSTSTYGFTSYWEFDNGTGFLANSSATNPLFTFSGPGPYSALLYIEDTTHNCGDTVSHSLLLANCAAVANFSINYSYGGVSPVSFHNTSTDPAGLSTINQWYFYGNTSVLEGSASTKDASFTYTGQPSFSVELIVKDSISGCRDTLIKAVTLPHCLIYDSFFAYHASGDTLQFQNMSQPNGSYKNPIWEFSNGAGIFYTSTSSNPKVAFTGQGPFSATLILTDAAGTCQDTATFPISASGCDVVSNFTYQDINGNGYVQFTNKTYSDWGGPYTSLWTFYGAGNTVLGTSSAQNPLFDFYGQGPFSAKLKVKSSGGCYDSLTETLNINVCFDSAAFTYQYLGGGVVQFTNTSFSTNGFFSSSWIFSNATSTLGTSALSNPTFTFTGNGPYTAFLYIIDTTQNCSDTVSHSILLSNCAAAAGFTYYNFVSGQVNFHSTSTDLHGVNTFSTQWYFFGDSTVLEGSSSSNANPAFNFTGVTPFYAELIVTDTASKCKDTLITRLNLAPCLMYDSFMYSVRGGDTVMFNNASVGQGTTRFFWEFKNLNGIFATSIYANPTVVYTGGGPYSATLIMTDTVGGCVDTLTLPISLHNCAVVPNYSYQNLGGGTVQFTNNTYSSYGWAYTSHWTFYGANNTILGTSTNKNPTFTFTGTGPFSASLATSDSFSFCKDTLTEQLDLGCFVIARFTYQNLGGGVVQFTGNSSGTTALTYYWTFTDSTGNIGTSSLPNPQFTFTGVGPYSAELLVEDAQGCGDTISHTVTPNGCTTIAGFTYVNTAGSTVQFTNTSASVNPFGSFWVFVNSSGTIGTSSLKNPQFTFTGLGPYHAFLQVYDSINNCYDTISHSVTVAACVSVANFTYVSTGGTTVQFTNTSTSSGGYTSNWTFSSAGGFLGTSASKNPIFSFSGPPSFVATLLITDSSGNCRDTVTQVININTVCITLQTGVGKSRDNELSALYPNLNENNVSELFAEQWTVNSAPSETRGLLEYNLSQIPVGSTILSAKLSLYANHTASNGYYGQPTYGSNNAGYLQQVTSAWNPGTVTWATAPSTTATNQVLLPQSTNLAEDYANYDISNFVQSWVNNPGSNYGMLLKMLTQNYYNSLIFCGTSYTDSTRWPRLDICYTPSSFCATSALLTYTSVGSGQVQFNNNSTSLNGYTSAWTFYNAGGVIGTSTVKNPLFTFTGQPPFSVLLQVKDSLSNCSDSVSKNVVITNCVTIHGGPSKTKNTNLTSYAPNTVDSSLQYFQASHWTYGGAPGESRDILQFDISSIPVGSVIVSAGLSLYADTNVNNGIYGQPMYGTNNACFLMQVNSPWSLGTATWNAQPTVTTSGQVYMPQSTNVQQNYLNLNVATFVQNWVTNPASNYGMELKMVGTSALNSMIFCSGHKSDSTLWPVLNICYIPAPCNSNASFTYQSLGGGQMQFSNSSSSTSAFTSHWTFYNSSGIIGTSSAKNPAFNFSGQAPFSVKLIVADSLSTCADTISKTLNITNCISIHGGPNNTVNADLKSILPNTPLPSLEFFQASQWTYGGVPGEASDLLKFDLSFIPTGSVITSASLNLYADTNIANGVYGHPMYGTANACYLKQVTSSWNPNTVTWNTQPTTTTSGEIYLPQSTSTTQNYLNLNLSAFVQNWVNNPAQNYGMELKMITSYHLNSMEFCTGHKGDSTLWPVLNICYIPGVPSCNTTASFNEQPIGNGTVQFVNSSSSNNGFYANWKFSNGNGVIGTSTIKNPQFTYTGQPPYSATLSTTDSLNGCADSLIMTINIATCVSLQQGPSHVDNSFVFSLKPDSNVNVFNDFPAMQWTWSGVPGEVRGLVKFDLAAIPSNATVVSAKLSLYADDTTGISQHAGQPTFGANNPCYLMQVTSPWTPSTVTWNTAPTTTGAGQVTLPQSTNYSEDYPNIDITSFVQGWMQNPASNYGMMLKEITSNYYNDMIFCSSSYPDTTKRPKLDICYFIPPVCNTHASDTFKNLGSGIVQFTNTSTSTNGFNSSWSFYDGVGLIGVSSAKNALFLFSGQPPYTAVLVVSDSLNSCTDTLRQAINIETCVSLQQGPSHVANSYVFSLVPDSNVNSYPDFPGMQWTWSGVHGEVRGLMKFDLASIPLYSTVLSAKLSLYADDTTGISLHPGQPTFGSNNACYLQQVTSGWLPNTVTWNTAPTTTTAGEVTLAQSVNYSEDYPNIDITAFVQSWLLNPAGNYGLMLREITNNYYNDMLFCSSSYYDTTKRPKLDICYLAPISCNTIASFNYANIAGDSVHFNNTSVTVTGLSANWVFTNANGIIGYSNVLNPTVSFSGQPPYTATLVAHDSLLPCYDTITAVISVSNCIRIQAGPAHTVSAEISSYTPATPDPGSEDFMSEQWTFSGTPGEGRGLIKFDLSSIPPGAVISSATLNLTANINSTNGYNGTPTYGNNNAAYIREITTPWNVNTVTWNTQPTTTAIGEILLPQSSNTAQNYYNLDVTGFVQSWVNNPSQNNGLLLQPIGTTYYNSLIFCSSYYPDSTLWPSIDICFSTNPVACSAVFTYTNQGDTVTFTDLSPSPYNNTIWNFGDSSISTQNNPVHIYAHNGSYHVTFTVFDSLGGCTDSAIIYVYGVLNDTLCGLVWNDADSNGILDVGETDMANVRIVINGVSYYTDSTGHFKVPVAGGNQAITVIAPGGWVQTFPLNPSVYLIPTTNNQTICGVDFGLMNTTMGIRRVAGSADGKMTIYPNPTSGLAFNIRVPEDFNMNDATVTVFDMTGREMQISKLERNVGQFTISLDADAASGVYMVAVKNDAKQMYGKVFIAK